ncbi:hypothetical protein DL96DRAFT_1565382 [Flagelloscypha sp. PMI_526]|nr:hypothetical protein DL96DRAFT_1565382 [Flagelloscypha sp. PMI_526]
MSDKTSQDTERRDYGTCIGYKRSQFVFPRQFPAESDELNHLTALVFPDPGVSETLTIGTGDRPFRVLAFSIQNRYNLLMYVIEFKVVCDKLMYLFTPNYVLKLSSERQDGPQRPANIVSGSLQFRKRRT